MPNKYDGPVYVIRQKIVEDEYFELVTDKRFSLINKCHNILVKHAEHLLNKLDKDKTYQDMLNKYRELEPNSKERSSLGKQMNEYRKSIGLSKSGLEKYIAKWQRMHSKNISSHQSQKEAARVMRGVDDVIFSDGKKLHFRKYSETYTICGKSKTNGISYDRETNTFKWMGETFKLKKINPKNEYLINALYPEGTKPLDISYCEIKRMMFPNGWHYYLDIYVKGTPPQKHKLGKGRAGIDPGTSTIAVSAEKKVILRELAPKTNAYTKKQKKLLKAMDKSRRATNPDNYDVDGKIKKGSKSWKQSNHYKELSRRYKSICRQKALYIRQSHNILANEILKEADIVIVEHMDYKSLQKRARETKRQDKTSIVKSKDGKPKEIKKYKRKKRFGKSLGNRAPAELLEIIKRKIISAGGAYLEVDTKKFKASQYNHIEDTYTKSKLSERTKNIGGQEVQRDLYSAFLMQNTSIGLDMPDRDKCIENFENFIKLQEIEINNLKASGISKPECFGF